MQSQNQPQADSAGQPPIADYIHQSWDTLTRSMTDCRSLVDPKLTTAPILYLPADMPTPPEVKQLRVACNVDIEKLPSRITHFGQFKLTDIHTPGLLYLPHPYVVPGGRFNEMYGWDSYFILLGLVRDGRIDLAKGMVENFFFEIEHYGGILNANRTYYFTRSQPPFLSSMIRSVYHANHDKAWLATAYEFAVRDYSLWQQEMHRAGDTGLARYYDIGSGPVPEMADDSRYYPDAIRYLLSHPEQSTGFLLQSTENPTPAQAAKLAKTSCDPRISTVCARAHVEGWRLTRDFFEGDRAMRESGFDTSFRFGAFSGFTHHFAPVCLNSLLFKYEKDMEFIASELGRKSEAAEWSERAAKRQAAIVHFLWNDERKMFVDYDFIAAKQSNYNYVSTFYPLWAGLATDEQARSLVASLPLFEQPNGLAMSTTRSGMQWDLPFGWAPCNWIAVEGLSRYGFRADAQRVAMKFTAVVESNYQKSGNIREKYDMITGSTETQVIAGYKSNAVGFGWTNGTYLEMRALLADPGNIDPGSGQ